MMPPWPAAPPLRTPAEATQLEQTRHTLERRQLYEMLRGRVLPTREQLLERLLREAVSGTAAPNRIRDIRKYLDPCELSPIGEAWATQEEGRILAALTVAELELAITAGSMGLEGAKATDESVLGTFFRDTTFLVPEEDISFGDIQDEYDLAVRDASEIAIRAADSFIKFSYIKHRTRREEWRALAVERLGSVGFNRLLFNEWPGDDGPQTLWARLTHEARVVFEHVINADPTGGWTSLYSAWIDAGGVYGKI